MIIRWLLRAYWKIILRLLKDYWKIIERLLKNYLTIIMLQCACSFTLRLLEKHWLSTERSEAFLWWLFKAGWKSIDGLFIDYSYKIIERLSSSNLTSMVWLSFVNQYMIIGALFQEYLRIIHWLSWNDYWKIILRLSNDYCMIIEKII